MQKYRTSQDSTVELLVHCATKLPKASNRVYPFEKRLKSLYFDWMCCSISNLLPAFHIKTKINAQVSGSFGVGWTWMALFDSLFNHFVGSFARAYEISVFKFGADWLIDFWFINDIDWFIDFSTRISINRFNRLETFFLSLISKNSNKIYVGLDGDICVNLKFWNALIEVGCFAVSIVGPTRTDLTALLPLLRLKIRSVRMLDTIVCSEPLV
jgi:hypothetical protein